MSWPARPADHGSDRYDYVEIDAPPGVPLPEWLTADYMPCPDCRANLFLHWDGKVWRSTVAHDAGCPVLREHEA
ncbi:MAG: hypothetical protein ACJ79H_21695 [Myxococcales bacterium]